MCALVLALLESINLSGTAASAANRQLHRCTQLGGWLGRRNSHRRRLDYDGLAELGEQLLAKGGAVVLHNLWWELACDPLHALAQRGVGRLPCMGTKSRGGCQVAPVGQ